MKDEEVLRLASLWADHDHGLNERQRDAVYAAQASLGKLATNAPRSLPEEHMAELLRLVITKRYP